MKKHGQGTHSTKMGADKLTESTPNAPKFICPNRLPKPKSLVFRWKRLHWASVVRGYNGRTQGKQLSIVEQMFSSMVILKFALKKKCRIWQAHWIFFLTPPLILTCSLIEVMKSRPPKTKPKICTAPLEIDFFFIFRDISIQLWFYFAPRRLKEEVSDILYFDNKNDKNSQP